jgi:hypothetical protein
VLRISHGRRPATPTVPWPPSSRGARRGRSWPDTAVPSVP